MITFIILTQINDITTTRIYKLANAWHNSNHINKPNIVYLVHYNNMIILLITNILGEIMVKISCIPIYIINC
jgi:hypothetical protein